MKIALLSKIKRLSISALAAALLVQPIASCNKGPALQKTCKLMTQDSTWPEEAFKEDYTIQFPAGYSGEGYEGYTFRKRGQQDKIKLYYVFCGIVTCDDFGHSKVDHTTSSVPGPHEMPEGSILNKKLTFCDKNSVEGIFFYNELSDRAGRLFWNVEGTYREALTVLYDQNYQDEVESIIATIKKN